MKIHQAGLTLIEVLIGIMLVSVVALGMSSMVGTAIKTKLIIASRTAGTETGRQTLEWMAERVRNAGLNINPTAQPNLRCKDMIVAQDTTGQEGINMQPTATKVYISGEILNSNTIAGDEVITLGYYTGADPDTGQTVVMEYSKSCLAGAAVVKPLSSGKVQVTGLSFLYYDLSGNQVTALTTPALIRTIRIIRVTLNVQSSEGKSGIQTATLTRDIMLRNPDPSTNNWVNPNEN